MCNHSSAFCGNVFFPLSFFVFSISIIILRKRKGAQYKGRAKREIKHTIKKYPGTL